VFKTICFFLLFTSTAIACPVSSNIVTGTFADGNYTIIVSSVGTRVFDFVADLPKGSNTVKAESLRSQVQALFDVRQPLIGIPSDDPDKLNDPNDGSLFWGDVTGAKKTQLLPVEDTYLVGRNCEVIVDVVGTGKNATVQVTLSNP